ncbi:MAG: hypothetical protein ACXVA9_12585 [Bdellovibrionales bacterium]
MKRRDLLIFLAIELFAIVWAGTMFTLLESKLIAGALAGGYFVVSGIIMLGMANHWPEKWKSITWYVLFVHVFVISLPMLMSRFAQMALSFEDVRILGLSGPVFHQISTTVFSVLIGGTILDWLRSWWAARNAGPTTQT